MQLTTMAKVQCPSCEETIDLPVNVHVNIDTDPATGYQSIRAHADNDDIDTQPLWDHQLLAHGPRL